MNTYIVSQQWLDYTLSTCPKARTQIRLVVEPSPFFIEFRSLAADFLYESVFYYWGQQLTVVFRRNFFLEIVLIHYLNGTMRSIESTKGRTMRSIESTKGRAMRSAAWLHHEARTIFITRGPRNLNLSHLTSHAKY